MTTGEIKELQRHVGAEPDGVWGPRSMAACQTHLNLLMPKRSPWPTPAPAALRGFYGEPGKRLTHIDVKGLGVKYEGMPVRSIACHERVAVSLERVLRAIAGDERVAWVLGYYAGCFNKRNIRGGNTWSLHAYGAAIDLWPEANGNKTHWPTRAKMPIEVMEHFAREGWMPAGAFWHRDAMHFQATSR